MSERLIRWVRTVSIALGFWLLILYPTVSQDQMNHPILRRVQDQWLHTPKSEQERKTKATVLGTTCNAVELDDAYVEPISHPPYVLLEYSKSVDITENSDACLDLTVPDIDTKFEPRGSLQNRPYEVTSKAANGRFPELRCCTLPSAFLASLISKISRWRPIFLLGARKNLV